MFARIFLSCLLIGWVLVHSQLLRGIGELSEERLLEEFGDVSSTARQLNTNTAMTQFRTGWLINMTHNANNNQCKGSVNSISLTSLDLCIQSVDNTLYYKLQCKTDYVSYSAIVSWYTDAACTTAQVDGGGKPIMRLAKHGTVCDSHSNTAISCSTDPLAMSAVKGIHNSYFSDSSCTSLVSRTVYPLGACISYNDAISSYLSQKIMGCTFNALTNAYTSSNLFFNSDDCSGTGFVYTDQIPHTGTCSATTAGAANPYYKSTCIIHGAE